MTEFTADRARLKLGVSLVSFLAKEHCKEDEEN
jgi:hypothetical protein